MIKAVQILAFLFPLALLLSISAGYIVMVLLSLAALFTWGKEGFQKVRPNLPFLIPIGAYIGWGLFTVLVDSPNLGVSLKQWRSDPMICFIFLMLFSVFYLSPEARKKAEKGFWAGILFLGIVGLIQFFVIRYFPAFNESLGQSSLSWVRRFSVLPHHHMRVHAHIHILTYAEMLAMAGVFALAQRWKSSWTKMGVSMLCFAAIMASQSRGAFMSYLIGITMFSGIWAWWHRRVPWKIIIPVVIISFTLLHSSIVRVRMGALEFSQNQDRLVMWRVGWRMIKDHPVTGVGIGHVKVFWERYCEQEWKRHLPDKREIWSDVHSLYIQQTSERGIPGLLFILFLLGGIPYTLRKKIHSVPLPYERGDENDRQRELLLGAFCVAITFLFMNLTESAWQDSEVAMIFLFITAVSLTTLAEFQEKRK